MLEQKQIPTLKKILRDYIRYKGKKYFEIDARILLKDLEEGGVRKREEKRQRSIRITKKELAEEIGIDQQTMMRKISLSEEMKNALEGVGWIGNRQKGFYPREVSIIREYFFGENYKKNSDKEAEK